MLTKEIVLTKGLYIGAELCLWVFGRHWILFSMIFNYSNHSYSFLIPTYVTQHGDKSFVYSLPILLASLRFLSSSSISTSLFMVALSQCLHPLTMLSASLDMRASFNTVVASFSTLMRHSSSNNINLLDWLLTSSSLSFNQNGQRGLLQQSV